jgi:hypothetical protein
MSRQPADPQTIEDNHVWTNALDALVAGAGRPEVRAGVLHLFATMPDIDVTRTPFTGHDALDVTSHAFTDRYQEELLIDAQDGTPPRFIGGDPSNPSVVISYAVSRVKLSDIASSPS